MIIVAGWIRVRPEDRQRYLDQCLAVIEAARAAPGCIDFHISADHLELDRINVFEQWRSAEDVEQFRGSGPSDEQSAVIVSAHVEQHEIATSTSLT